MNNFSARSIAVAGEVARSTRPLLERFDRALSAQQALVDRWRFLSPAVLMFDALGTLAGTDGRRYRAFERAADGYVDSLQAYYAPLIANRVKMDADIVLGIPQFRFNEPSPSGSYGRAAWTVLALIGLCGASTLAAYSTLRRIALLDA
jgi:ABC-2 type transport system permease protein